MLLNDERSKDFSSRLTRVVDAALKRRGISARQASIQVVGHDGLVRDIRAGRLPSPDKLEALFEFLEVDFQLGKSSEPTAVVTYSALASETDFARIRRYDVHLSGGAGAFNGGDEIMAPIAFRKAWFRRHGLTPESCCIVGVRGDSMEPKLFDGDLVLLDVRQADLVDRAIYGIVDLDGEARVKRIEAIEGGYLLRSENPYFKTELRLGDDAKRLKFIGRVVTVLHEMEK